MATLAESPLPEDIEDYEECNRWVEMSLDRDSFISAGTVVATFHYLRVKAVRVAMKVALRRGEVEEHWTLR